MSSCCGVCGGQDAEEVKQQEQAANTGAEEQQPADKSGTDSEA